MILRQHRYLLKYIRISCKFVVKTCTVYSGITSITLSMQIKHVVVRLLCLIYTVQVFTTNLHDIRIYFMD
jgi:hypothetical protein